MSAQEPSAISSTFTFDQRLESSSNLGLEIPSEGDTTLATTTLGYAFSSETATQSLSLNASAKYREGNVPAGSDTQLGLVEPRVTLRYALEGVDSKLTTNIGYREDDVTFLRPLSDFVDANGVLILPSDAEDLYGGGTRNDLDMSASLRTGIDAPLGFNLDLSHKDVSYQDVTSGGLNDFRRSKISAGSSIELNEVATANVGLSFTRYEADDIDNTERDTTQVDVGLNYALSARSRADVSIGYTEIETTESGVTTTTTGPVFRAGYEIDMANGTAGATFASTQKEDGERNTLRFSREMTLPAGSLETSLGVTKFSGTGSELIGGVRWQNDLPTGSMNLRLNRDVRTASDDSDRIATTIGAGYTHSINDLSSLSFNASYAMFDNTGSSNDSTRTDLSLNYSYALTSDWDLNAGVTYRVRDEDLVGKADSTTVYVGIGRSFTVFH
ncbi:hypothetical protein [Actibacterium sp. XHP0104]|uniref:hypothetical protein n=1 Tax=Actibacterium sp. XHP0104 TaxID=2984335 RepID=UPI0021E6F8BF|nr:hypothetical protein [Actibacterium sp. XHP0104]MCV2881849.1 hypothetical protein [Actibacterium sp. XHP0104]